MPLPRRRSLDTLALCAVIAVSLPAAAQTPSPTRMLADPAISGSHIAFVYDRDLWIAERDGANPRRLTSHPGRERSPRFSPNGQWLAFTGEYDGNSDVFVVSVAGGAPRRMTWHPAPDLVQGWTPDGRHIAFASNRMGVVSGGGATPMTVALDNQRVSELEAPVAFEFDLSDDGAQIAFTPAAPAMGQWKHYRGGRVSRIWVADRSDLAVEEVSKPAGGANDLRPMWIGDDLYFLSDRDGEFNLYRRTASGAEALTHFDDHPVLSASAASDGTIVYEQAGWLHTYDTRTGADQRLDVVVASDLVETRARWADGSDFIQTFDLSPTGARALFEARGDIVTVPAQNGDVRLLTQTPGVHERSPVWSPDGSRIAFFSDESGEYDLYVAPADDLAAARRYPLSGAGFYDDPKWSPDGSHISFTDNGLAVHVVNVESAETRAVGRQHVFGPIDEISHNWSHDSKWLAFTTADAGGFGQLFMYSVDNETAQRIDTGLGHLREPVFDRSGKYLYFLASTDAGPVQSWFDMSNNDTEATGTLYMAILDPSLPSPLAPKSDEESAVASSSDSEAEGAGAGEADDVRPAQVELNGLGGRVVPLGVGSGWFSDLQTGAEGHLYYRRSDRLTGNGPGPQSLRSWELASEDETTLLERAGPWRISADGKKLLVTAGGAWHIADVGEIELTSTRIKADEIRVRVDPRQEWAQMLREVWRQQRDIFYDPDMHGADWDAMWERYAAFLPDLATRNDLDRVTQWMLSELAVGHSRQSGPGEGIRDAESIPSGLLGADYEVSDGRWRFARIYRGEKWNPGLRAPLAEPGMNIEEGDYLLAVNGTPLTAADNPFAPFEGTAGRQVSIAVGPNADGSGQRTLTVVPIANDLNLRLRSWLEANARAVREATDGRVAYVWVPDTGADGWAAFKRYFFAQAANAEAIIVDERFNGGGQLADYVIDLLDQDYGSSWAFRYGDDLHSPTARILGPKVMLINEWAGSGGDYMPWMFRQRDLGTLIGTRTWGGLVGILGTPPTMDGASWTAPNVGFWTEEEGFGIENVGIAPDIEVEQDPALVAAGRDPQLERAIEEVMRQLEANPVVRPTRPPFPVRVREGG